MILGGLTIARCNIATVNTMMPVGKRFAKCDFIDF